jgi:hypothetical protein
MSTCSFAGMATARSGVRAATTALFRDCLE